MKITKIVVISFLFLGLTNNIFSQIDYSKFEGKEIKTSLEVNLKNPYFKEYGSEFMKRYEDYKLRSKDNDMSSPANTLVTYYSVKNYKEYKSLFKNESIKISNKELEKREESDTLLNTIRLSHRLTFDYQNKKITFFKYRLMKDSVPGEPQLLVMEKMPDNSWKIITESGFKNTEYAIKHLKSRAFWEFFNRQDDQDYLEINKLKPLVQDPQGVLNIEKLGQVIEANKVLLNKYLD